MPMNFGANIAAGMAQQAGTPGGQTPMDAGTNNPFFGKLKALAQARRKGPNPQPNPAGSDSFVPAETAPPPLNADVR